MIYSEAAALELFDIRLIPALACAHTHPTFEGWSVEDRGLLSQFHQLQIRRGHRPRSIVARQGKVRSFMRWLGPHTSILDATQDDFERFLDGRKIGPRTRYTWISHLHAFYQWAIEQGLTESDPTLRIVRPKLRRTLPRPARTEDLIRALEAATRQYRCWIVLAAFQGLRCQEVAGLRREDVIEQEGLLRIDQGKGAVERIVPLHPQVLVELMHLPMPRQGWIFRRPMGGPYNPAQVSAEFNKFLRDVGVNATAHSLRHWFGTHLYAKTRDLRLVQEMLGHASPTTTAIYTQFDRERAIRAIGELDFDA